MANKIKGITIELNGDATGLDNALKDVNKETRSLHSELRQVESALKFNPGNMDLMAQKADILGEEITSVSEKLKILQDAQLQVAKQFENGEISDQQYRAFERELIKTESQLKEMEKSLVDNEKAMVELETSADGVSEEIEDLGEEANDTSKDFEKFGGVISDVAGVVGKALATMGVAAAGAATGMIAMTTNAADQAKEISNLSDKTGLATGTLQEWKYIAEKSGTDIDNLQGGLAQLAEKMDDATEGTGESAELFKRLGLSVYDTTGKLKSQEQMFEEVTTKLQEMEDGSEKAAIASKLLGGTGEELMPIFNGASGSIEELKKEAHDLGAVMEDDTINSMVELENNVHKLKTGWGALANAGGAILMPMLTELSNEGVSLIGDFTNALNEAGGDPDKIQEAITGAIDKIIEVIVEYLPKIIEMGITILTSLIEGIVESVPKLVGAATEIIKMLSTTILDLLPMLLGAAIEIILILAKGISDSIPTLIPAIVETVLTMVEEIINNLPLFIEAALEIIMAIGEGIINSIPILIDMLPELIEALLNFITENLPNILNKGIDILLSLIDGIIETIPDLIDALPKVIDAFIKFVVENLPTIVKQGIEILLKLTKGIIDALPDLIKALPEIITTIIDVLVDNLPEILKMGIEILIEIIKGIISAIPDLVEAIPEIVEALIEAFVDYYSDLADVGVNIVEGVFGGILSAKTWFENQVKNFFSGIVDGVKDVLGIHSPSRVFAEIGNYMAQGLGVGFDDEMNAVKREINDAVPTQVNATVNGNQKQNATGIGSLVNEFFIENMQVRNDEDIEEVAREFNNMTIRANRGYGNV